MKNTFILGLTVFILWCWFPTFGPGDIITFMIIDKIGIELYITWSVIILIISYNIIEGKGIQGKYHTIAKELKNMFGG